MTSPAQRPRKREPGPEQLHDRSQGDERLPIVGLGRQDGPASQQRLGWTPTNRSLIADLEQGRFFNEPEGTI